MPECPDCGTEIPPDGRFCPHCGLESTAHGDTQSQSPPTDQRGRRQPPRDSARETTQRERSPRGQQQPPPRQATRQPPARDAGQQPPRDRQQQPRRFAYPTPSDHKLLVGSVGVLAAIGLFDGLTRVLSPGPSAEQLLERSQGTGIEMEAAFAEQLILATGVFATFLSVLVLGLTIQNYRRGQFKKRYFWVLVGVGILGFLFASSLFLMVLAGFGIYGLVSVMD